LENLNKLDLSNNPIQTLPKFEGLDRLRYIRMAKTNIQEPALKFSRQIKKKKLFQAKISALVK